MTEYRTLDNIRVLRPSNTYCVLITDSVISTEKIETVKKSKGNLFPTDYRTFFWTILGSQWKWNAVFDKFIERVDTLEAEQEPLVTH